MLRSYTKQQKYVEGSGSTVEEVLDDLNTQFPGIKFRFIDELGRIRTHMKLFVNREQVDDLTTKLTDQDELFITQALSGGS